MKLSTEILRMYETGNALLHVLDAINAISVQADWGKHL